MFDHQVTFLFEYFAISQGKLKEAEPLYKQALSIRLKSLGEGHPNVGTSYNDLGSLKESQGMLEEAEKYLIKAVECYKKVHGEDHPWVATALNNLAEVYKSQVRFPFFCSITTGGY